MSGKSRLTNMMFDEVSLVRRPANQHASIVFSKADEGGDMPGTLLTEDGYSVEVDDLEPGTELTMDDGQTYVVVDEEDVEFDEGPEMYEGGDDVYEYEDAEYGKSYDGGEGYADLVSKAYTEAVTDDERTMILADVAKAAAAADERADAALDYLSKMQQDGYVEGCIAKAEEYGIAGPRTGLLGITIAKACTVLEPDEIELLDDIFKSFAALAEDVAIGTEADGMSEVLDAVQYAADDIVKSAGGDLTQEQAMALAFEQNPDLYGLYLSEREI